MADWASLGLLGLWVQQGLLEIRERQVLGQVPGQVWQGPWQVRQGPEQVRQGEQAEQLG